MGALKNHYHDEICMGASGDFLDVVVHDLWRDARLLSSAPKWALAENKADLIEAREALNDAIAKAG